MKKTLSLLAAALVFGWFSVPAQAANHYVSGAVGISWMNDIEFNINTSPDESEPRLADAQPVRKNIDIPDPVDKVKTDMGSGITLLGAVGCDYGDWRLEGELGYQKNDFDKATFHDVIEEESVKRDWNGDVSILSLMANGYYDIPLGSGFEFSLSAGIGIAQVSIDNFGPKDPPEDLDWKGTGDLNETTFAWQVGAGFGIPVAENVMLDLRYRYFATTDFDFGEGGDTNIASHNALLGLRVGF